MTAVHGRADAFADAEEFLRAARAEQAVLLLEGDAGIGKSTVWRAISARATAEGFRVLRSRPAAAEAKLALSAVTDLLQELPEPLLTGLPAPQQRALDAALLRAAPGPGPSSPRTLATAVRSLLARLAARQPLVVALDDVQWLDPASAGVLTFALRRLGDRPIGWLLTRRLGDVGSLVPEQDVGPPALRRCRLGPPPPRRAARHAGRAHRPPDQPDPAAPDPRALRRQPLLRAGAHP